MKIEVALKNVGKMKNDFYVETASQFKFNYSKQFIVN